MIYDTEMLVRYAECGILEEFISKNDITVGCVVNQIVAHYSEELENLCCELKEEKEVDE